MPAGQKYGVVRRHFAKGIVVGYITPDGQQRLNPRERDVVPPGSQLVFVAHGLSDLQPLEEPLVVSAMHVLRAKGIAGGQHASTDDMCTRFAARAEFNPLSLSCAQTSGALHAVGVCTCWTCWSCWG
jgi:hypothetical protein